MTTTVLTVDHRTKFQRTADNARNALLNFASRTNASYSEAQAYAFGWLLQAVQTDLQTAPADAAGLEQALALIENRNPSIQAAATRISINSI